MLTNQRKQSVPSARLETHTIHDQDESSSSTQRYRQLMNDMKYTWTQKQCLYRSAGTCSFCNSSKRFLTCLLCTKVAARGNIKMHDYSGGEINVLCRACVDRCNIEVQS